MGIGGGDPGASFGHLPETGWNPWRAAFRRGDVAAFFALTLDNLSNIVLLAAILVGGFGFPAGFFFSRMVPGTALGVCVGDLAYTVMAVRLMRRSGRRDVTAMPLGLDTPSTVGMAAAVLGPVWKASGDPMVTWQVGMATLVLMGVLKTAAALAGEAVRRLVPRAALLGAIGGVGFALLAFLPLVHVISSPVAGWAALGLVLYALVGRRRLPGGLPGAAVAVAVGTGLHYVLGALGLIDGFALPPAELSLSLPRPTLGFVAGLRPALDYLPLSIPFGLLTVVGGINVTESALVAGDRYSTRNVLLVEAAATLVAGLTGGVAQSVPYIGHPAYKAMGAGAGYTLAAALFVGLGGALGVVQFAAQAIPAAAVAPVLIFVGIEITGQAFLASPRSHLPAVVFALLPSVAELVRIAIVTVAAGVPLSGEAGRFAHHVDLLAHGFILTGMLWGAAAAELAEGRPRRAAGWFGLAAGLTAVGLIHSVLPSGALYLPWQVPGHEHWLLGAGYLGCALMLALLR